jgi:ribose transport system substrate-binding protein
MAMAERQCTVRARGIANRWNGPAAQRLCRPDHVIGADQRAFRHSIRSWHDSSETGREARLRDARALRPGPWRLVAICAVACASAAGGAAVLSLEDMRREVRAASQPSPPWDGPVAGPAAAPHKTVALLCEELRNGGILGVARGVEEAARVIGWTVKVFDAGGTAVGRERAAAEALAARPDALAVVGADARDMQARLAPFAERKIPIVGWHVGPRPGAVQGSPIAVNVTTDPLQVARVTAMAAVVGSGGKAGVVVFTDSTFDIATVKARAMADVVRGCAGCALLEVRDLPISRAAELVPAATRELLERHGARWTHALAVNDIYFDYAVPELARAGRAGDGLALLSAGDGSSAAYMRIRAKVFQVATVAEPLTLHGWQLVDELNRLFARAPVSGYVVPVHLSTPQNIAFDGGPRHQYDPDSGYRDVYRRIWRR